MTSFTSRFTVKTAEFNTNRLSNLAASLANAFSANGITGIVVTSMNIQNLNSSSIQSTGANIAQLTVSVFTGSSIFVTGVNTSNITTTNLVWSNATGSNLQLFQPGTQKVLNTNQFYQTAAGNNLVLGSNISLTGGGANVFVGPQVGTNIGVQSSNTLVGAFSNLSINNTVSNSIAIGSQAIVGQSNCCVFGNNNLTNILPGTGASVDLGISYQPFRNLYITGSFNGSVLSTGSFTLTTNNYGVFLTGAGNTITLPTVVGNQGLTYKIINSAPVGTNVSIATTSSQTFNGTGASPFTLTGKNAVSLFSDGQSSWWIV